MFKGSPSWGSALSQPLIDLADRWYWGTAVAQGSGLSSEEMGTGKTWPLLSVRIPSVGLLRPWDAVSPLWFLWPGTFYVPASLTPSNAEPIKQVCHSPASWTGRVCKCCLNAPPGEMTPRGLVRVVISSPSPCQETVLSSSSLLLKLCHLWLVTMNHWSFSYNLYGMANALH